MATVVDAATGLQFEIITVTAVVGNVLTVQRAQEGTAARAWSVGDFLSIRVTAAILTSTVRNFGELPSGINLNALTGSWFGQYQQSSNSAASQVLNYPVAQSGSLEVICSANNSGDQSCTQIYSTNPDNKQYKRTYNSETSTWSTWAKIYNSSDVIPVSNGGTGVSDIGSIRRAILVQGLECNDQTGPQSYNSYRSPNSAYTWKIDNSGLVQVIKTSDGSAVPIPIESGGTGGITAYSARVNLSLDRLRQEGAYTELNSANGRYRFLVNDSGDWGGFDGSTNGWKPLAIAQGGTGSTTLEGARTNLKIDRFLQGDIDTKISTPDSQYNFFITDADWGLYDVTSLNRVALPIVSGGTGGVTAVESCKSLAAMHYKYPAQTSFGQQYMETGVGYYSTDQSPSPGGSGSPYNYAEILTISEFGNGANYSQIAFSVLTEQPPRYRQRFDSNPRLTNWRDFLIRDLNTSVDSNGFIKIASPIVKIRFDGSFELNSESEGCTVSREGKGHYLISGCLGLNSDAAWGGVNGGFEIPVDVNKQPRIWLDYKVNEDGSVDVFTYHRVHNDAPVFARNNLEGYADGDPIDIPKDAFISVRVQMPK
ncbi:TPA: hypothetical protein NPY75_003173 [Escherichia coli]|nr:hypothetical protein [Escherichia coli]